MYSKAGKEMIDKVTASQVNFDNWYGNIIEGLSKQTIKYSKPKEMKWYSISQFIKVY